ncbi:hypothetical protein HAX54_032680 [Datura stramonium]|uniref:Uncharacterized protein n=1 Tax=Datura stramonium TaxID=4076 RepID=A0ABS8VC42_DATST|nr:hypothetical protein [Datura stramonium]
MRDERAGDWREHRGRIRGGKSGSRHSADGESSRLRRSERIEATDESIEGGLEEVNRAVGTRQTASRAGSGGQRTEV